MNIKLGKSNSTDEQTSSASQSVKDFLPAALEIQQSPPSPLGRSLLWVLLALFTLGVVWASVGKVDIVATAQGKVIPNGKSKIVQSAVSGRVDEIHVVNGQRVEKGDLLIALDSQEIDATTAQLNAQYQSAQSMHWRLKRLLHSINVESDVLIVDSESNNPPDETEVSLARAQYGTLQSELRTLSENLREREADHRATEVEQQKWQAQLPLIQSRAQSRKKLVKNSHVSKDDWQAFEQNRIEAEYSTTMADERKQSLQASMDAIKARKEQLISSKIESWELQLLEQTKTIAQVEKELLKVGNQADAHNIRAPVSGHVQELSVNTQGAVLTTAEPLLKVVPEEAHLEVEALVANKDIGFITEGQKAKVKIDAFPFTRFGAIEGKIESISSDAIEDRERGWVYRTSVSLSKDTLNIEDKDIRISPGMSVAVEVKTGKRKLMEFFMSPLLRYRDESARER